jgi:predicted DCC family thiol-disulfide oxidoreductase YuxK
MEYPVVLFDGVCNFCNGSVNFLIRHDRDNAFLFAPLQSPTGQALLDQYGLDKDAFSSFVVVEKEKVYTKSRAFFQLTKHLPWYWKTLQVFRIIPRFIRDAIYDWIAKNRYQWFGRKEACMIPSKEQKEKFI